MRPGRFDSLVELKAPDREERLAILKVHARRMPLAKGQVRRAGGGRKSVSETDPELAPWMKRLLQLPREETLSKPALETLAIIAYRQPLTKAEIEAIRGVDGTATLDTLLERQFVRVLGRKDTPGRPLLYGTTDEFLRHFGLKSVEDLPPMPQGSAEIPGLTRPHETPATHDAPASAPAH